MISRIFLIGFFIFISLSCERSEHVVINGIVTDEVTGNPVSGASVGLKLDYQYDGAHYTIDIEGTTTTTGPDGSYRIDYETDSPATGSSGMQYPFPKYHNVYASSPGLAGSYLLPLSDAKKQNINLKVHHFAQLNLHVRNDGKYKLNECYVWLDKKNSFGPLESPKFYFSCKGQDFDSIIIIKDFWGNFNYYYGISNYTKPYLGNIQSSSLIAKPDSTTDLFITF